MTTTDGIITLYLASSVDGYIADEDGGVGWLEAYQDADTASGKTDGESGSGAVFEDVDALLMGAHTYEQILGFGEWPYGARPTHVVTARDLPRATDAVTLEDGPVTPTVDRLTTRDDHVWLVGGAQLAQTLLRADQVDELRRHVVPVVLGDGIRLFEEEGPRRDLDHQATRTDTAGGVDLPYSIGDRVT